MVHKLKNKLKSRFSVFNSPEVSNFQFMMGQTAILASRARHDEIKNLWDAEVKVYSQWGEDGILDYLCERIEISKPKVLEIGAGNFTECNSRFLAENRNASVYAVDGRIDLVESMEHSSLRWKNHIFASQIWVTPENINPIISEAQKSLGGIDIFSLDLDGNDYWILEKADLGSIKIVIVEYNPLFGHTRAVTIPRDDLFDRSASHYSWLYYGASLGAFEFLLGEKEFDFIGTNRVGNNAFFVKKHLASTVAIKPNANRAVYTDWRIRESRSITGELNYLSGNDGIKLIEEMDLLEVNSKKLIKVREANLLV